MSFSVLFCLFILKKELYFSAVIAKKKLGYARYNVIITNNYLIEDQAFSNLAKWIIIVSSDPHKIRSFHFKVNLQFLYHPYRLVYATNGPTLGDRLVFPRAGNTG